MPHTMSGYIQANTNGRLHAASEPSIRPTDRGFLYGDAVYEVWRTYAGTLFAWDEHWQRLAESASALHLRLPWPRETMLREIRATVAAYREKTHDDGELYIRLQISRGSGAIGLDVALADEPEFVLLVQSCPRYADEQIRQGLALSVARALRRNPVDSLSPAWKTGNYLNNILGLREARSRGADEVVMLNLQGHVAEAAVSNIAFIRDDCVVTPPISVGILAGITRRIVLGSVAPAAGLSVSEERIVPADFGAMSECFLLSSTKDITPVARVDGWTFAVGAQTRTARLKTEFGRYVDRYVASHPELRVDIRT